MRKSSVLPNRAIDAPVTEPRALAHALWRRYCATLETRAASVADLARWLGVAVGQASWRTADDRLFYLAECQLDPPHITLNAHALALAAARTAIDPARLTQLAIAHELYHILTRQPSCARGDVEQAAHQFAETLVYQLTLASTVTNRFTAY